MPANPLGPGYVYVWGGNGTYKIGKARNVASRLRQLTKPPFVCTLVRSIPSDQPYVLERALHHRLRKKRTHGEWFRLDDNDMDFLLRIDGNSPLPTNTIATPPQNATDAPHGDSLLPVALSSMASRQDATDKRVDALQQAIAALEQRQSARTDALVTGLLIGGAVVLIVVALVLGMAG